MQPRIIIIDLLINGVLLLATPSNAQPPTTAIGVAYIQDGRLQVAQRPTRDRRGAMQAFRLPYGGTRSNPFRSLAELIEGWNRGSSRRVVLMITDGIDAGATSGQQDTFAETALQLA